MSYQLDPAMLAFIESSQRFPPSDDSLAARRAAFLRSCRATTPALPAGWRSADVDLQGVRVRCYKPEGNPPAGGWPTVLYIHGGGWSLGNLDTHDWFAHALARRVSIAIVAVDYRLTPEHHYPAPLEDCLQAFSALREGQVDPSLSRSSLMVAGDSAGGTLAAGLCLALRRDGLAQPLGQVLVYPVLTARHDLPSMREHANAPLLCVAELDEAVADFIPDQAQRTDPCAMPLEAEDLTGLAPAFMVVARIDPLCDHGLAYRDALLAQGGVAEAWVGEGMVHSSLRAIGVTQVEQAWDQVADQLQRWAQT